MDGESKGRYIHSFKIPPDNSLETAREITRRWCSAIPLQDPGKVQFDTFMPAWKAFEEGEAEEMVGGDDRWRAPRTQCDIRWCT
jgi:hypothetical protein